MGQLACGLMPLGDAVLIFGFWKNVSVAFLSGYAML